MLKNSEKNEELLRWFPTNATSHSENPILYLICIPGAGMDSSIFTSKNSDKSTNYFVNFALNENMSIQSVQLPGRSMRFREQCITNAYDIAVELERLLKILGVISSSDGTFCNNEANNYNSTLPMKETNWGNYVICAHSMGCLCAFELLRLLKRKSLNLPRHVFFSCMSSPDLENKLKPFKKSRFLSDEEFKNEVRGWNKRSQVFKKEVWDLYEPLLRNDFRIFDEYEFHGDDQLPLGINATLFYATEDERVTKNLMLGWTNVLGTKHNAIEYIPITSDHNFFYDDAAREFWARIVAEKLDGIILDIQYC